MNDIEISAVAEKIFGDLFSKSNEELTKDELINLIKERLVPFEKDCRELGKRQILNHFKMEIKTLHE